MRCVPKNAGYIIGGFDPVAVDYQTTKLMGFDPLKIQTIAKGMNLKLFKLGKTDSECVSNVDIKNVNLNFKPPYGWKEHIELN